MTSDFDGDCKNVGKHWHPSCVFLAVYAFSWGIPINCSLQLSVVTSKYDVLLARRCSASAAVAPPVVAPADDVPAAAAARA